MTSWGGGVALRLPTEHSLQSAFHVARSLREYAERLLRGSDSPARAVLAGGLYDQLRRGEIEMDLGTEDVTMPTLSECLVRLADDSVTFSLANVGVAGACPGPVYVPYYDREVRLNEAWGTTPGPVTHASFSMNIVPLLYNYDAARRAENGLSPHLRAARHEPLNRVALLCGFGRHTGRGATEVLLQANADAKDPLIAYLILGNGGAGVLFYVSAEATVVRHMVIDVLNVGPAPVIAALARFDCIASIVSHVPFSVFALAARDLADDETYWRATAGYVSNVAVPLVSMFGSPPLQGASAAVTAPLAGPILQHSRRKRAAEAGLRGKEAKAVVGGSAAAAARVAASREDVEEDEETETDERAAAGAHATTSVETYPDDPERVSGFVRCALRTALACAGSFPKDRWHREFTLEEMLGFAEGLRPYNEADNTAGAHPHMLGRIIVTLRCQVNEAVAAILRGKEEEWWAELGTETDAAVTRTVAGTTPSNAADTAAIAAGAPPAGGVETEVLATGAPPAAVTMPDAAGVAALAAGALPAGELETTAATVPDAPPAGETAAVGASGTEVNAAASGPDVATTPAIEQGAWHNMKLLRRGVPLPENEEAAIMNETVLQSLVPEPGLTVAATDEDFPTLVLTMRELDFLTAFMRGLTLPYEMVKDASKAHGAGADTFGWSFFLEDKDMRAQLDGRYLGIVAVYTQLARALLVRMSEAANARHALVCFCPECCGETSLNARLFNMGQYVRHNRKQDKALQGARVVMANFTVPKDLSIAADVNASLRPTYALVPCEWANCVEELAYDAPPTTLPERVKHKFLAEAINTAFGQHVTKKIEAGKKKGKAAMRSATE